MVCCRAMYCAYFDIHPFHNFGFGVEHLSCQSSKVVEEGDEKVR